MQASARIEESGHQVIVNLQKKLLYAYYTYLPVTSSNIARFSKIFQIFQLFNILSLRANDCKTTKFLIAC